MHIRSERVETAAEGLVHRKGGAAVVQYIVSLYQREGNGRPEADGPTQNTT